LAANSELARDLNTLKAEIKQTEKIKGDLMTDTRRKISRNETKALIL